MTLQSTRNKRLVLSALRIAAGLILSLWPRGAQAAVFDIPDGDVAALIGAINTANANGVPDTINLAAGGTYTLTAVDHNTGSGYFGNTGLPLVTSPITINGNGATIQRSSAAEVPNFRILAIASPDATLNELTIRGGRGVTGAGLLNGYIVGYASHLRLINSTVTDNDGLNPNADGGGVLNYLSTLYVKNSTISNNRSFGGYGGGGILNFVATLTIINSTLFENKADGPPGFQGRGDAIADAFSAPGSILLKNSVLASPSQGLNADCYLAAGILTSLGHNLASDASCQLAGIGDRSNTNPMLGPLASNGGPTPTHAPLLASPVLEEVPLADCTDESAVPIATDQRGVARPQGAACDIGSVEPEIGTIIVAIDIKPGSFPNSINPRSKGGIPVAILTTATFDATTVDPATPRFGATGTEAAPVHVALADVDGDGDLDMILHFRTQDTGIQCGHTSAVLTGETFDGALIEGTDSIQTVGC